MFLNDLPKTLIEPYLNLAYTLIYADESCTEEELNALQLYATELGIIQLPEIHKIDFTEALLLFSDLDKSLRKKVYFELFSLSYVDTNCTGNERNLLKNAAQILGITENEVIDIENITMKLIFDYEQLGYIINA